MTQARNISATCSERKRWEACNIWADVQGFGWGGPPGTGAHLAGLLREADGSRLRAREVGEEKGAVGI